MFIMPGAQGRIARSTDGINWAVQSTPADTTNWNSVIFANGMYIITGTQGRIARSTDGINWTIQSVVTQLEGTWNGIVFGGN
jgi:photosystem II stability/assembly factor-like uncharacterized protein